jgi:hypothetical protein
MRLTILSVAYPLAPVGPDAVGGAEQVLGHLDRALVAAGHRSIVVAQAGSDVAGELVPVPAETGALDDAARERAWGRHRAAIAAALQRWPIDLVHLHGIDFANYVPSGVPVLATLHLPPSWYPDAVFRPGWPNLWLNPVSRAQQQTCAPCPRLLAAVENGVPVAALQARHGKRRYAVVLGRICPEKGVHLAIEAAKRADLALLIGGEVFAYDAHERYFREEVEPRLDRRRRYLGPIGFARKRRLLTGARCLLVPSLAPETSSLVAREALACGTPVIAFPNGALPETIDHGRTGFLVRTVEEMADAIDKAPTLSPDRCREAAAERFSLEVMSGRYIALYRQLLDESATMPGAA